VPKVRQTYAVSWNGGDLVKVSTNARDMAVAQEYMDDPGTGTFAVIHHCLVRSGYQVPDLDAFIDQLDELDLIKEEGSMDPTQRVGSGSGLSLSDSLPEPIPGSGLTTTEP
jgi:hypothetical protein